MGSRPITLLTASSGGAVLVVPTWCVITLVLIAAALTALRVVVTQVIRLRASAKITSSAHALQLLTQLDNPRGRSR